MAVMFLFFLNLRNGTVQDLIVVQIEVSLAGDSIGSVQYIDAWICCRR